MGIDMEIWKNIKLFIYIMLNIAILFNSSILWVAFVLLAFNFTILEAVENKISDNRK